MKKAEEAIEKVLAGLCACDPSPGKERRILKAVQDRDSATARSGWRQWLFISTRPAATRAVSLGIAVAAVLAITLAIPFMQQFWRVPTQSAINSTPSRVSPPSRSSDLAGRHAPTPLPEPVRTPAMSKTRLVRKTAPLALRELLAASRPAPQVPLTKEEKLLLRVIRTSDPAQLAMLNPVVRARQSAESKADFRKFFELTATGENE